MADEITLTLEDPYIGSAYSPQVTVEEIEGGHSVTITSDVPGEGIVAQTFDVMDGDASQAIEDAEAAAAAARAAASSASSAATGATNAASAASTAAGQASTAAGAATDAASAATGAATSASAAAADATEAAGLADDATVAATAAASNAGTATRDAITATTAANNAAATANAAAGSAAIAAADATTAAGTATDAATSATSAASAAGTAADAANTAATAANAAAEAATEAAEGITDAWLPRVTVGASDGITGGGPLDTASWLQRVCPGSDGPARIESIHGRTLVWNQQVPLFSLSSAWSATINATTETLDDGRTFKMTSTAGAGTSKYKSTLPIHLPSGHMWYIACTVDATGTVANPAFGLYDEHSAGSFRLIAEAGSKKRVSGIGLAESPLVLSMRFANASEVGDVVLFTDFTAIDLTQMFGAGNEPSTVAEFESMYPEAYYPYDAGSLQPVRMTGVESVGFNQWDEQWELGNIDNNTGALINATNCIRSKNLIDAMPSTVYYFRNNSGTSGVIHFYDSELAHLGYDSISTRAFTTPAGTRYLRFRMGTGYGTTYKHDLCINISGPRNGEYEPYRRYQRAIDAGVLRSAGTVYDELTATERIVRVRERAYQSGDESDPTVTTDGTTTHYALATPTTTPIDPALNLTYKAAAGGTERILHDEPTAPPTLVIQYGSTADGIRDRALEAIAAHDGPVAQTYHAVGTYLTMGGSLYRVTTAIAAGERIASGTNVVATTVMAELLALTQ